jgi:hypothetical protein
MLFKKRIVVNKQFTVIRLILCRSQDASAGGDASSPGSGQSESTCGTPPTNSDTAVSSAGEMLVAV